jgi:CubicO group peptidase (beta-lactamase class C family)
VRTPAALLTATCLALASIGCSGASLELGIPPADAGTPRPPNLAWWSRAAMDALLRLRVWSGGRSGFVAAFARDGHPIHATAVGWADVEGQRPMTLDTPVRIASMTKPITAVAAHILIEEGRLGLDDPVASYLPAWGDARVATSPMRNTARDFDALPADPAPTVRHLLMFASGIGPGIEEESDLGELWAQLEPWSLPRGSLAERVDRLAGLPLFEPPGTRWRYGASADVLARVVEVAAGQPFDAFLRERIFEPLGMQATGYDPPPDLAVIYTQDEGGDLVRADIRGPKDWTPGGGGLVSTAGDYLRFALMLWNGGAYDGVRILKTETVAEMTRAHIEGVRPMPDFEGLGWGLGLAVAVDADATLVPDRDGDYWWAGAYATTFFVSPTTGLVGVILGQNHTSEHSGLPLALYGVQGLALAGL